MKREYCINRISSHTICLNKNRATNKLNCKQLYSSQFLKGFLLIIAIELWMCMSTSAQIQRVFMGSTLGISKSAVLQNFKAKGYTLTFDGRFYEKTKLVSFAGMTWTNLCINITTNKFSEFWVFTTDATKYQYEQVYESINKKYSKYRQTDKLIPWYDDGRTIVYITYVPSRKYLCLSYCDKKLLYKSIAIDESEL